MLFATFVGSAPAAVLYAVTGALAVSLNVTLVSFFVVLIVAGIFWIVGRQIISNQGEAT
jgi:uncharacterized membrane protein YdjX (TVP38/TMEM64 family)